MVQRSHAMAFRLSPYDLTLYECLRDIQPEGCELMRSLSHLETFAEVETVTKKMTLAKKYAINTKLATNLVNPDMQLQNTIRKNVSLSRTSLEAQVRTAATLRKAFG